MLQNGDEVLKNFAVNKCQFRKKLLNFSDWYFHDIAYELPILNSSYFYDFCYDKLESRDIDPQKNKDLSRTIDKLLQKIV